LGFVFRCKAKKSARGWVFEIGSVTYFINASSGVVSEITHDNKISERRKNKNRFILQGGSYEG
jgi:hypothetical protein